jgi:hypothetical protein
MQRCLALALLLMVPAWSARPARAESEPSCETVTTVRCTGSAAPLALPGATPAPAAPPAPPPAPVVMPPMVVPAPLPPQADDAEVPRVAPPPPCCAEPAPRYEPVPPSEVTPTLLPGGWRLVRTPEGLMMERKKRTGVAGMWAPGLALWLISYLGTTAAGYTNGSPWAAAPFAGGFIAGGIALADGKVGPGLGWSVGSIMQLSGFVMFLVGTSIGEKIQRIPVAISPLASRDGGGVAIGGRF